MIRGAINQLHRAPRPCPASRSVSRYWLWLALVAFAVVPWGRFQDHTHWQRVVWVPFSNPPLRTGDIMRNTVLYLPLGVLLGSDRRAWQVAVAAFALSAVTELTQVFSHGRVPSATDVTTNVLGAVIGYAGRRAWSGAAARGGA